jgi:phosphoglycerate kinase
MIKKTVRDIDVAGKRVLVRVDFNVPLDKKTGVITDDSRIRAALPTISYLRGQRARVILVSHLGRPDGKVVAELRLAPVAERLAELLEAPVEAVGECVGPEAEAAVARLQPGGVLLLENVRFHAEEEKNDPEFARQLAALADLYVDDAFGTAHRAHASTEGVTHYLPAVAGLLMEKELTFLAQATERPQHPYVAIIGGAKVSDKIGVLQKLTTLVDTLLIGGGMANTFLRAQGFDMQKSLVEEDQIETARAVLAAAAQRGAIVMLPTDVAVAEQFSKDAGRNVVPINQPKIHGVPPGTMALDIGPETAKDYALALKDAKLIIWNGPMGVFEFPNFAVGTMMLADAVGAAGAAGATTIVGGGETVAAVNEAGVANRISHISTGGGASLEFLEGKSLPGVAALQDA